MTQPETPRERRDRQQKELQGRNISHYQVLLTAWIQTRMERDKALVAISSAGLGLLVTIAGVHGVRNEFELAAFIIGLISFALCIAASIRIYQLNARLIENQLIRPAAPHPPLKQYDYIAVGSFIAGVTCFSAVSLAAIIYRYIN